MKPFIYMIIKFLKKEFAVHCVDMTTGGTPLVSRIMELIRT